MPPNGSSTTAISGTTALIASTHISASSRAVRGRMAVTADASALSAEGELVVTRIFEAPRGLLFKMWTEPEHLARWWGPRRFTGLSSHMDVRPGGTWTR